MIKHKRHTVESGKWKFMPILSLLNTADFDQNIAPTTGICPWVFPSPLPLSLCATSLMLRALTANSILRTSKSLITVQSLS